MESQQLNTQRFVYTITKKLHKNSIKLNTGVYFSKMSRSDELIKYTESNMESIVKVLLYFILQYNYTNVSILHFVNMVDKLFGYGFCMIIRRPIQIVFENYRLTNLSRMTLFVPSELQFLMLNNFIWNTYTSYSFNDAFILQNSNDHKKQIQSNSKNLNIWNSKLNLF